jgi:cytoskeleton protein RodZ
MLKTAQLLKEAREKKGLTLSEVSIALKINIKVLQSIENAETDKLPAKAFLRGFIKSYAQYLKMNVDEVITSFNQEMGIQDPKPVSTPPNHDNQTTETTPTQSNNNAPHLTLVKKSKSQPTLTVGKQNEWSTFKKVGMSALVIVLVSMIYFIKTTIEKYEKESILPPVESNLEESLNPATEVLPVTPAPMTQMTSGETAPSPVPQNVVNIPATQATSTPVAMQVAVATPRTDVPVTVVKPAATPTVAPTITPKPSASPTPTASPTPQAKKPQEIIIEALDKVEISYTLDNGKTEVITLNADQVQTFKAKSNVKLKISNGGAVNIIQNGRDRGVPGDLGKPIQLNY